MFQPQKIRSYNFHCNSLILTAVWTGLEPATPCVTGRYSNQLNYHTVLGCFRLSIAGANIGRFVESTSATENFFPTTVTFL
jgi:hypothetical protein